MRAPDQKKSLPAVIFFLLLGAIGLGGLLLFSRSEPFDQGKSLTTWAQQYGSNHWSAGHGTPADTDAELAIRRIGAEGIPFLLDRIRARDTALKQKLRRILPSKWHDGLNLKDRSGDIRRTGAHGLAALGTNASTAVPALIEIGTNHPDEDGRYTAVFALRTLGPAAEPAIPFFVRCLTNSSSNIRGDAAIGLGAVRLRADLVVPALINYLDFVQSPRAQFYEARDAIGALAQYGTNAKPAVPLLLSQLNNPQVHVREAVTNLLHLIDPEAAAKAGLKRPQ